MRRLITTILAAILAGCASQPQAPKPAASAAPMPSTGFDLSNLDRSTNACTDFYQFANGGWKKTHPDPSRLFELGQLHGARIEQPGKGPHHPR